MNILIVGCSAAGTAAVEAIRTYDWKSSIVQLSEERDPLYSRCLLPYWLSGAIAGEGLRYRDASFHRDMQVTLHEGKRAVRLDAQGQRVVCDDGSTYPFDRLLIATGSSAKLPDNIPCDIGGVCALRTRADAEIIRAYFVRARGAVVLGGGLIGLKAACALGESGMETTVVMKSDRVLSQMIDGEASRIITARLRTQKVGVLEGSDCSGIDHREGRLTAVVTDQGQTIPCELLIVAKGVRPNVSLAEGTGIAIRSGIVTTVTMQTTQENIFAAGDVAETYDIAREEYAVNALWTCAVQQGRVAGLNMIGRRASYDGAVGMNALNIGGIPLIAYGMTNPREGSGCRVLVHGKRESALYRKIILKDHRIRGIILLGRIDDAGVLLSLIRQRTDVSAFEEELMSSQFNFAGLLRNVGKTVIDAYQSS